jgi:hypothetical protein
MYIEEPKWRNAVTRLIQRARLVVLRIGTSPGFVWEMRSVLAAKSPAQVILLVPQDEKVYEDFRRGVGAMFPAQLPVLTDWKKRWFRGNLKAAIMFQERWLPIAIDLQNRELSFLRRSPSTPLVPVFRLHLSLFTGILE